MPPSPTTSSSDTAWIGSNVRTPCRCATLFPDSDAFLLAQAPGDYTAYVIEDAQTGVSGMDLLRLVRKASPAACIVFLSDDMRLKVASLQAGADAVLGLDSEPELVDAALEALRRRTLGQSPGGAWMFDASARTITTPRGDEISLTPTDVALLGELARRAPGEPVSREHLREMLWPGEGEESQNTLHATVYRLRRRLEQQGDIAPLQAVAGQGYVFRAPLGVAQRRSARPGRRRA